MATMAAGIVHLIPYLVDHGWSPVLAAIAAGTLGVTQVAARLAFGPTARRTSASHLAAGILGLPAVAIVVLALSDGSWMAWIAVALLGAAQGTATLLRPMLLSRLNGPDGYGRLAATSAATTTIARATAPLALAALAVAVGYGIAFALFAAASVAAAVLAVRAAQPASRIRSTPSIHSAVLDSSSIETYGQCVDPVALRAQRHAALGDPTRLAIVDELASSDRAPLELQRAHPGPVEPSGPPPRRARAGRADHPQPLQRRRPPPLRPPAPRRPRRSAPRPSTCRPNGRCSCAPTTRRDPSSPPPCGPSSPTSRRTALAPTRPNGCTRGAVAAARRAGLDLSEARPEAARRRR